MRARYDCERRASLGSQNRGAGGYGVRNYWIREARVCLRRRAGLHHERGARYHPESKR
jgi:hypothetical protein